MTTSKTPRRWSHRAMRRHGAKLPRDYRSHVNAAGLLPNPQA
ncbi:hypothetical protein CUJ84_pRLN2000423 (plasmid) [Rhizobium leguminosarum]|uniref:Uncharacterized protein n=1 Tax=Rhizobium leguminosarum TaxID=384 RepID=A0A2K9ZFZ5_RHILE|nr:hypothetical protein CUJ84_pRLN2000423 [Rhizobium leguminosarum]